MRRLTPIIVLEDKNNYSILYFAITSNDIIAMFQSVDKNLVKNKSTEEVLLYMQMYGEDMKVPLKSLNDIFKGDRIVAIIP